MWAVPPRRECPHGGEWVRLQEAGRLKYHGVRIFSQEERWQFYFNSLNSGFKYFLREGIFCNIARTKFIIQAVGENPTVTRPHIYIQSIIFADFIQRGLHFSKRVNIGGKYSFLFSVTAPFLGTNGQYLSGMGRQK